MHIERHFNFATLADQFPAWNALAQGVPFRQWEWVEAWWRHYGCDANGSPKPDYELLVLAVHDDAGHLIGVAPWYRHKTRTGARVIRFLGDGEVCSDHLTLLCDGENQHAIAEELADWLTAGNQTASTSGQAHHRYKSVPETNDHPSDNHWDRLEIAGVAADDEPINLLLKALAARDNRLHHSPALNTWNVALPATWEEFLMLLSKPHRNRLRRADKNFLRTGRVTVHYVHTPAELPKFFDTLVALHQGRWQRRGMPGCFASEAFCKFHREISERFIADGRATLSWLELDGTPLAAEYRLHGEGTMYAYQCGIDPDRLKVQPGELANMTAIRNAIEHGQQQYDFLRGDEPYKAHWRAQPRPQLAVRVVPKRASARLRHTAWLAGQSMKEWVKSGLELTHLRHRNEPYKPVAATADEH
ncbi:MAG TPA: GNAT family N-acetyltransferase [Pirellulales bacterium]|jgi:CelD/BcsL family acetyltransferase involved in cellulose biosynthesis